MNQLTNYKTKIWLTDDKLDSVTTSDYWNNEDAEKNKHWWGPINGDFEGIETYLRESGLADDLREAASLAQSINRPLKGVGADFAAGTLWAIPYILSNNFVSKVYCVEMSRHRLFKIGPKLLEHYKIPHDKVELCLGSFYDTKFPDNTLDFVLLAAAFHHADDPDKLLLELRRVLKPDGVVLIIGEHKVKRYNRFLQTLKFIASRSIPEFIQRIIFGKTLCRLSFERYWNHKPKYDPVLGDQYYFCSEYKSIFARNGFRCASKQTLNPFQFFVIWP